jgi:hypothetical protein
VPTPLPLEISSYLGRREEPLALFRGTYKGEIGGWHPEG